MLRACRAIGLTVVLAITAAHAPASAQSVNVDFGAAGSAPASTYAAQGLAGVWNSVGVLPPSQRISLTGLNGFPSGIQLYMIGGTALLASDDPATTGDDAALLDDMLIGYNDPIDVCVWFANVPAGDYEVILYGLTPNDPNLQHRLRVDYALPGATMCGGSWAGFHQDGISFVRFLVHTESGYIGLHSGLQGGNFTSGLNGVQLRANPPTSTPPPGTDASRSGVLGAFPNPSAATTGIAFALSRVEPTATLQVVDVSGRIVWSRPLDGYAAGIHVLSWDGRDRHGAHAPAGVYFARLRGSSAGAATASDPAVRIVRTPTTTR